MSKGMVEETESIVSIVEFKDEEIIKDLQRRGYFVVRTPMTQRGKSFIGNLRRWNGNKYRFGIVSDTHLGSRYQQLTHLGTFYSLCQRRGIDTILHAGDLVDGEKMYRGQEYEIFVHGADAQREYAVAHYPKRDGVKTLLISGNHDQSFIKTSNYNIVRAVCREREDMEYLGDDYAKILMGHIKVALLHGRGGVAYARSYKGQKIVEQMSSEEKPHILFMGHYHVPCHLPGYRNVEMIQMSCFQRQTPYLVGKGLQPHVAGLIVEVQEDDDGLAKIVYEWIPFYKHINEDF